MKENQNKSISQGFISGNQPKIVPTPTSPINIQDTEIFSKSPPPPVSLQAGNLEVLTQLTDPSKMLLRPQNPINNPKQLYVTVVKKKINNGNVLRVLFINRKIVYYYFSFITKFILNYNLNKLIKRIQY